MRYFTHYWSRETVDSYVGDDVEGTPLDHSAGALFTQRGIAAGDVVYVVTTKLGRLFLLGKLKVADILFSDRAAAKRLGYKPWPAKQHLIASECTPTRLQLEVPTQIVSDLMFASAEGYAPPKFSSPGVLDRQTLRGVRELDATSANRLDALLPVMTPFSISARSAWRRRHPA